MNKFYELQPAYGRDYKSRINPGSPVVKKITGPLTASVFVCESWTMNETQDGWIFGKDEYDVNIQIATSILERMERVSSSGARLFSEQQLRHRDDEWRKRWAAPGQEPLKIIRCSCGVGDEASRTRHTLGCFCRGEF